jgi:hypothetical protein
VKIDRLSSCRQVAKFISVETPNTRYGADTMMTRSIQIALLTAGLAATPIIGAAATSPTALDSCVKAFMADISSKEPRTLKLLGSHYVSDGNLHLMGETSAMALVARDAHDHHELARALCTVDYRGGVVNLQTQPINSFQAF